MQDYFYSKDLTQITNDVTEELMPKIKSLINDLVSARICRYKKAGVRPYIYFRLFLIILYLVGIIINVKIDFGLFFPN